MEKVALQGWDPDVVSAISGAIQNCRGKKVATFDFDHTCIEGDIGELFSHFLARNVGYRTDLDAFWDLIHLDDGRDELRQIADEIKANGRHRLRGEFVGELASLYARKLQRDGKRETYAWAVLLHTGLSVEEMLTMSRTCLKEEREHAFATETWPLLNGETIEMARGLRARREMRQMMRWLERQDVEVWIVSASNHWTVSIAAEMFDIPASRALGNRTVLDKSVLTSELEPPSFYREGKREVVIRNIGSVPVVAFGDSDTDIEMLEYANVAITIDHGSVLLANAAKERGWFTRTPESFHLDEIR